MTNADYEEKWRDVDLKAIETDEIKSPDECLWVMRELDDMIGDISLQLDDAKLAAASGEGYSDRGWFMSANRALKGAKTARNAMQGRMTQLRAIEKQNRQIGVERAFMSSAFAVLDQTIVTQIWDHAHATNPDAFK